jgi:hypothetical protein
MAGVDDSLFSAIRSLAAAEGAHCIRRVFFFATLIFFLVYVSLGVGGFYLGWFPALVQKIPSYALTWMMFQQLKQVKLSPFLVLLTVMFF